MEFLYGTSFLSQSPEAYERLITRRDARRRDALHAQRRGRGAVAHLRPDRREVGGDAGAAAAVRGGLAGAGGGRRSLDARPARSGARSDARRLRQPSGRAEGTTPGAIEAALREMLKERHAENASPTSPARALNLVCVVDKAVERRDRQPPAPRRALPRVAHDRAARSSRGATASTRWRRSPATCTRKAGRVRAAARDGDRRRRRAAPRGPRHDRRPARRHRPADRAVVAARPPGGGRQRCCALAQVVLLDSSTTPTSTTALERARELLRQGLRRRPRVAALDAVARARGGDVRPAAPAPRPAARSARSRSATTPSRPPPRCCSSAGWRRGWAGSRRAR